MELVEVTRADVLAEFWFALASGMEQYSDLNELAVERASEAREVFERQLDRDDTTVFLIQAERTSVGFLMLREGYGPHGHTRPTPLSSTCSSRQRRGPRQ